EDLHAAKTDLYFGKISGNAKVYLNGKPVGSGFGAWSSTVLDVSSDLHEGENTVAIVINAEADDAGPSGGAALRFPGQSATPQWSRSAFNGFGQAIVASSTRAGDIRLTAEADGLKAASLEIHSASEK
ncbi:MAG TPA: hypothetical protein VIM69_03245, partial [Opitutaceae bacterium]